MKKSLWKLGIILTGSILLMTGCTGKKTDDQTTASKDHVYRAEILVDGSNEEYSYDLLKNGDQLLLYHYIYDDETTGVQFTELDSDGKLRNHATVSLEWNTNLNQLTLDQEGNVYAIQIIYADYESEDSDATEQFFIKKFNRQGEELLSVSLNEIPQIQKKIQEEGWFYIDSLTVTDEKLILLGANRVFLFDKEGNYEKSLDQLEEASLTEIQELPDGRLLAVSYPEDGMYLSYLNLESGELEQSSKLPGGSYGYAVYAGDGKYDAYLTNGSGVYGYHIGDTNAVKLMDYVDSDVNSYQVYNILPIDQKSFYAQYEDMDSEYARTCIARFTKVPPSEVKDKTTLVLACVDQEGTWEIRNKVVAFNKTNEEYRITIQNYSDEYNTDSDYTAGQTRLNADLAAGKIPDVLILNDSMPIDSYISKGLFEDLTPYIEQDEEIQEEDLMPNVIEALSENGKLYRLVPYYFIKTVLAKTSDVGEVEGWTLQEAKELLATKKEGTALFTRTTRGELLNDCMNMASSQFIDFTTGKCDFNSPAFMELLEFLKQFPEDFEEISEEENTKYWENYDAQWREEKVLAETYTLTGFRDFNYEEKGRFGEPVTMIGYPSGDRNGSAIRPGFELAISAKSKAKEGAWQFARYFLTEEYQNTIEYGFPISVRSLKELGKEAVKPQTYLNEDGTEEIQDELYYMNGMDIKIDRMTEEEVEKMIEKLYNFHQIYHNDQELIKIIEEESASYFNGQKTVEEVAAIVQSRAQIYVNENR